MRFLSAVVVIWLIIGVIAAAQRDYFESDTVSCGRAGTIALTIVTGPVNYIGANPKVDCEAPEPSK